MSALTQIPDVYAPAQGDDLLESGSRPAQTRTQQLSRLYSALSDTNAAIAKTAERDMLLQKVCDIAVRHGGFKLAAVRMIDPRSNRLETAKSSGDDHGYLAAANRILAENNPIATGPTGTALRNGRAAVNNDFAADQSVRPWHAVAARAGIRASATFPLFVAGAVVGGFSLYSEEPGFFDRDLVALLTSMADNLSFALEKFEQEARRGKAESDLRESEGRYRALSELSADYYWDMDDQHRFTGIWCRPGLEPIVPPQSYIGKTRWELPSIVNVSEVEWNAHRAVLAAHQPFRDFLLWHADARGPAVCFTVSGHPVFDGGGAFRGYRGISRDVTPAKRDKQLLVLEHKVTRCLADADDAPGALRAAIRAISETEGWEWGRYLRVDDSAGVLRFDASCSTEDGGIQQFIGAYQDVAFASGVGLAGRVWQSSEPQWSGDILNDERVVMPELARASGMRCAVMFPVTSDGNVVGVIAFNGRNVRAPDERLLRAFRVIGSQIGQFLLRKKTESERRESEERFRSLTELSSDWYWEQNEHFRFTSHAGRVDQTTGLPPEDDTGKTRWELPVFGVTEEEWRAHRDALAAHIPFREFTYQRRNRNGQLRHVSISGHPVFDEAGAFRGYRGIGKDISAAKRDESILRRFRAAMDLSVDSILLVDRPTMRFIDVNDGACRMLGYTREELLALGPQDVVPMELPALERSYDTIIVGEKQVLTSTYRRKDGCLVPVEITRSAVRLDTGWIVMGIARDITNRIAAAESLKRSAYRQRLFAELCKQALADTDEDALMAAAVSVLSDALGFEYAQVLKLAPDGLDLILRAATGWPVEQIGTRVMVVGDSGHTMCALACSEPVVFEDIAAETRFTISSVGAARGVVSGICVAIPSRDGPFGVIGAHSASPKAISAEDAAFVQSIANLLATALQRKQAEQQLAYLAQFDTLTGLANRQLFRDRLLQALAQARRGGWPAAVLYLNLDNFNPVNERYGREAGDLLLVEVSQRLAACAGSGDTVSRLGGDEFGILLPNLARADEAGSIAQKIVEALAQPFHTGGNEVFISASTGIALCPGETDSPDGLIKNAHIAMYRAKQLGRDNYQFYTAGLNQRTEKRLQLEEQLRHALAREEFFLHYQPKVDLATGDICGAEALLRWRHPELGVVFPAEFIPVLEDTGLILPVGLWVLRTACEQLHAWQSAGSGKLGIAVNLSPRQFQQPDLAERAREIAAAARVDPRLVELEITESMLMNDPEHAAATLAKLKASGFKLSVDDFGTGYSSLAYLKAFPLDTLKIDRAFVNDIATDPDDAAIALAIINLAHNLRLNVVAEGVENEPQLNFLMRHGCDQLQGYLFSPPVEAEGMTRMLAANRKLEMHTRHLQSKPTLLLLDDNKDDLILFQHAVADEGYEILTARTATQAFELLAENDVHVVVSDHHMPGMSGVEFLSRVKQIYPHITRVMVTGTSDPNDISEAINGAAIHKFLLKDWGAEQVRSTMRQALLHADLESAPAGGKTSGGP